MTLMQIRHCGKFGWLLHVHRAEWARALSMRRKWRQQNNHVRLQAQHYNDGTTVDISIKPVDKAYFIMLTHGGRSACTDVWGSFWQRAEIEHPSACAGFDQESHSGVCQSDKPNSGQCFEIKSVCCRSTRIHTEYNLQGRPERVAPCPPCTWS